MSFFFAKCLALVLIIGIRFDFSNLKFAYLEGLLTPQCCMESVVMNGIFKYFISTLFFL